jgi:hypothetical protein
VMDCCTYLAPLTTLSGLLDPFTTERVYSTALCGMNQD